MLWKSTYLIRVGGCDKYFFAISGAPLRWPAATQLVDSCHQFLDFCHVVDGRAVTVLYLTAVYRVEVEWWYGSGSCLLVVARRYQLIVVQRRREKLGDLSVVAVVDVKSNDRRRRD